MVGDWKERMDVYIIDRSGLYIWVNDLSAEVVLDSCYCDMAVGFPGKETGTSEQAPELSFSAGSPEELWLWKRPCTVLSR
jgi:hypothetical protein